MDDAPDTSKTADEPAPAPVAGDAPTGVHIVTGRAPFIGPRGFGGTPAGRRCSFCDRREDAVARLVRARGTYICDACIRLAATAIDDPTNDLKVIRIRPRPVLTIDRGQAEEAIERAFETVLGGDASDADRSASIEGGRNLADIMRQVRGRFPARDQVDVSVEYIRFVDDTEAEVSFVLILPGSAQGGGMHMPSKGYAIREAGTWRVARATYAELVGRLGITLPPSSAT